MHLREMYRGVNLNWLSLSSEHSDEPSVSQTGIFLVG